MDCNTCHRCGQWWQWWEGGKLRRAYALERPAQTPAHAVHVICPDCIGGIASCCDAAGSAQPAS